MGYTVLLIEDNELNRDMLSRRLARKGFHVITAEDGRTGVALAASEMPHLVLMDMSLPIMDGWEAARYLKQNDRTRTIPIIALTAHAMAGDEQRAYAAGCDDFDTKPIDMPRLLAKMETALAKSEV